jgi:hypothetical protein
VRQVISCPDRGSKNAQGKLAEDFDQIGLRDHDFVNVLADTRHFIVTSLLMGALASLCSSEELEAPIFGSHRRK